MAFFIAMLWSWSGKEPKLLAELIGSSARSGGEIQKP
jgi:hypothetical protein